jgi:hypothetical protein
MADEEQARIVEDHGQIGQLTPTLKNLGWRFFVKCSQPNEVMNWGFLSLSSIGLQ